jgi:hypothetical protein
LDETHWLIAEGIDCHDYQVKVFGFIVNDQRERYLAGLAGHFGREREFQSSHFIVSIRPKDSGDRGRSAA